MIRLPIWAGQGFPSFLWDWHFEAVDVMYKATKGTWVVEGPVLMTLLLVGQWDLRHAWGKVHSIFGCCLRRQRGKGDGSSWV